MDGREEYAGGRAHVSGHFHFTAPDPSTINGTVNLTINDGAHTMTMNHAMHGKWVSADCGEYAHKGGRPGRSRGRFSSAAIVSRVLHLDKITQNSAQ
jgi:hypothetical protein